jgi:hypothetical protein
MNYLSAAKSGVTVHPQILAEERLHQTFLVDFALPRLSIRLHENLTFESHLRLINCAKDLDDEEYSEKPT